MNTQTTCKACGAAVYGPTRASEERGDNGLSSLILKTEHRDELARLMRVFPPNIPHTLRVEYLQTGVKITPVPIEKLGEAAAANDTAVALASDVELKEKAIMQGVEVTANTTRADLLAAMDKKTKKK